MKQIISQVASQAGLNNVRLIRQLSDEATGSRWLIDSDQGRMVLTADRALAREIGLDRSVQFELLKTVYAARLGPKPIFLDAEAGVALVGYIDGQSLAAAQLGQHNMLARIAGLLARLHALNSKALFSGFTLVDKLELYTHRIGTEQADAMLAESKKLLARNDGEEQVLCHNDVHHGNIVVSNNLALIDWDYAGSGAAWFDLATVIGHHELRPSARDYFLDAYFDSGSNWSRDQMNNWLRIYSLVTKLWELCVAV